MLLEVEAFEYAAQRHHTRALRFEEVPQSSAAYAWSVKGHRALINNRSIFLQSSLKPEPKRIYHSQELLRSTHRQVRLIVRSQKPKLFMFLKSH